jgi:hypothetical protein
VRVEVIVLSFVITSVRVTVAMRVKNTLESVIFTLIRVKLDLVSVTTTLGGYRTFRVEINLVRVEITLVRVVITFERVGITLGSVKITLCV